MNLTLRLLGVEVLHLSTDPPALEPDDTARDLSGGTLGHYPAEAGPTDWHMGFTNGLEGNHA